MSSMGLRSFGGPLAGQDFPDCDAVNERLRQVGASADGEYELTGETVLGDDWVWLEVIRWRAAAGRRPRQDGISEALGR